MKARISQLYMTEADQQKWAKWAPEAGELVVYAPDVNHPYARIKVGDGVTPLEELSFHVDSAIAHLLEEWRYEEVIDGGRISKYCE
jgi:hypothetical protein